jgi:hypothetical protein
MRRRSLTELATTPGLISGIYNYCDRWCERCPFTSRCLVFATEQEFEAADPNTNDITNAAFWDRLTASLHEANRMISQWASKQGLNMTDLIEEEPAGRRQHRRQNIEHHPLARAGKKYANSAVDWFRYFDNKVIGDLNLDPEQLDEIRDVREIVEWYQYQIAVKTIRALSSRRDEAGDDLLDDEEQQFPKDSDGSAKVALIGIDRSIAAWRLMQLSLPQVDESTIPLLLQLERLRRRLEKAFPGARGFVRPGFDEVHGTSN